MLYDILVSFIGAFLGFVFALLSEAVIELFVRKRDVRCYLQNIYQELLVVHETLKKHKDNTNTSLMFDIPIWEAFIQSGDIRYLIKKSFYFEMLEVYSKLKKANELEAINQNDEWDALIVRKRNEIFESLEIILHDPAFLKCL